MKKVLFSAILIAAAFTVKSQELMFKVNQSAVAPKNTKTGGFSDAEVIDAFATIVMQNNKVLVEGNTKASYTLYKKAGQTKINNNVVSYTYKGTDEKNLPISFVYTVNLTSKEAVVEVADDKLKNYYFGTYSSSDLTRQQ